MKDIKIFTLEVLTPLFIGDGDKYYSFECIYDKSGYVNIIDYERLFEYAIKNNKSAFVDEITLKLQSGRLNLKEACSRYNIDYKPFIKEKIQTEIINFKENNEGIYKITKTAGKPYVPGSSIKGALRSSFTKYFVLQKPNVKQGYVDAIERAYNVSQNKKIDPQKVDDKPESILYGDTYNSLFRLLRISDTLPTNSKNLKVYETKIMNICNNEIKWYSKNENKKNIEDGVSIYLEGFYEGTKLSGYINIHEFNEYMIKEAEIKNFQILSSISKIVKEEIKNYIDSEIKFFTKYQYDNLLSSYNYLRKIALNLKDNEFLIQFGFGTGMSSKTIVRLLDNNIKGYYKNLGYSKVDTNLFPKTRRVIYENGEVSYVPGWVKITLER